MALTMALQMTIRIAYEKAKIGFVFSQRGVVMEAASSFFLAETCWTFEGFVRSPFCLTPSPNTKFPNFQKQKLMGTKIQVSRNNRLHPSSITPGCEYLRADWFLTFRLTPTKSRGLGVWRKVFRPF